MGTFSVPYDSQRDVYMAMIDDLDAAMETLYTFASAGDGILMRDFDISSFPSEDNYRQRKQQESNPLLRMTPGYEVADTCNLLFEAALDRAFRDLDNWRR